MRLLSKAGNFLGKADESAGNGVLAKGDAAEEGQCGLKKVKGFDGTEFGVIGWGAIGSHDGMKNEQAAQVGVEQTAHSVRTVIAHGGQFSLRFPQFENEFDLPAQAVDK